MLTLMQHRPKTEKTWQEKLVEQVKSTKERSFNIKLRMYEDLLIKEGENLFKKNTTPISMQRLSAGRDVTDVFKTHYKKIDPDTGRYVGYDHVSSNMGNVLVVTDKDITDRFGNFYPAYSILHINGNTNLVLQCNLLNGKVSVPEDYTLDEFVAPQGEKLDFHVIVCSTKGQLSRYYGNIDNTANAKSKGDNYTSCLVGHNLLDCETGKTDLVHWTTKDMDRPLAYLAVRSIPKDIDEMDDILKDYLDVLKKVRKETTNIVNHGGSNSAIWKAFMMDITKLEIDGKINPLICDSLFASLKNEISSISDKNVMEYWDGRFFSGKRKKKTDSKIQTQIKTFREYIKSARCNIFQLNFTFQDWILWELFSIGRNLEPECQAYRIYGHQGNDILGMKGSRECAGHQALNFLRLILLYCIANGFANRFEIIDVFEWASENGVNSCTAIGTIDRLDLLGDMKVRLALKAKIYS